MTEAEQKTIALNSASGWLVQYDVIHFYADWAEVVSENYYEGWDKRIVAIMQLKDGQIMPPIDLDEAAAEEEKEQAAAESDLNYERAQWVHERGIK